MITEKTKRHLYIPYLQSINIILLYIFSSIQQNKYFIKYNYTYIKYFNIFLLLKYFFSPLNQTLTSNLLKSIKFVILKNINKINNLQNSSFLDKNNKTMIYNTTVQKITLFIHKNKLNKLLFFLISTLLLKYQNTQNFFNLNKNGLVLNTSFYFFSFLNLFYFKIRSY